MSVAVAKSTAATFVLGLDHLVHRLLHVLRWIDLLELGAHDLDAPVLGLLAQGLLERGVDLAALAVGGLERERADDVAQRGAREVHDLQLVVVDVVLRALDALLVALDLEVDLRVDARVELVARDDLLALRVDHHLGDVDEEHPFDHRRDPVKPRLGHSPVLAEALDQPATGRPNDPHAREQVDE